MTRIFNAALVAATLGVALSAAANHVDFIGDDGTSFDLSVSAGQTASDTQTGDSASLLGGTRVVTIAERTGFLRGATVSKGLTSETIDLNAVGIASSPMLTLDYPAIANSDFDTMWNFIAVDFPTIAAQRTVGTTLLEATLTVESSAGTGTVTKEIVRLEPAFPESFSTTLFYGFDEAGFSGVDFTDVDGVTLVLNPVGQNGGTDYSIGSITREVAVPEPTSLALLGLGGLAALRRRRA